MDHSERKPGILNFETSLCGVLARGTLLETHVLFRRVKLPYCSIEGLKPMFFSTQLYDIWKENVKLDVYFS